jgi:tetratricopeptide (TPR) repeat protein
MYVVASGQVRTNGSNGLVLVQTPSVEIRTIRPRMLSESELMDSYELAIKQGEITPDSPEKRKRFWEAEAMRLTEVLRANPRYQYGFFERGGYYLKLGLYDKAITDLTSALRAYPADADALNNRGVALARAGKPDEAIIDFSKALDIRSGSPRRRDLYLFNRALAAHNLGRLISSLADLNTYIFRNPDEIKSYQLRADVLRRLGKTSEADEDDKKAKRLDEKNKQMLSSR